ncbi:MAG: sodium:solute symporter family protein [Pseudomonadota bacterium]
MAGFDWIVVCVFLISVVAVGLWFNRRASGSIEDYFISGRQLPWWLAGTSILAASFSSDTPLHVTRVIREGGLANTWFYWNGIVSGLVIAFFFAKLWRRAGIVTDAEFIELRYSGKPAAFLRGTTALFRSVVLELITLSWVILGMTKIIHTIMDLPRVVELPFLGAVNADVVVVTVLVGIALGYTTASGLWGVVFADFVEFIVAMGGAIVLAVVAFHKVGGIEGLREGLAKSSLGEGALGFLPTSASTAQVPTVALVVYFGVQWWANTEVDGSGKRAQRFLACKNEGHALASGVWNMAVQWLLRSWPWYIAAIASVVIYPELSDHETAYPRLIADLMPIGLKGLMVASFLAAFLSTVDSQLNLSASYLLNDIYKRFLAKNRSNKHYVRASKATVIMVAVIATSLALVLPSLLDAFRFKMELMAGLGLIYVLRWCWWRVTAWTELIALSSGVITALVLHVVSPFGSGLEAWAWSMITIVSVSGALAITSVSFISPEPMEKLRAFYSQVNPPALFWGPVAASTVVDASRSMGWNTVGQYFLSVIAVFAGMFSIGKIILGEPLLGFGLAILAIITGGIMLRWTLR